MRLAIVSATVLAVILLACWWGPPVPYKVGQVFPTDLRVRAHFAIVNEALTEQLREEAVQRLPELKNDDPVARQEACLNVQPIVERYPEGMLLVPRGQPITEAQWSLLVEEHRAFVHNWKTRDHVRRGLALVLVMTLLSAVVVLYGARFQPTLAQSLPKIAGVCLLVLVTLLLSFLLGNPPWHAISVPLTLTAMILTIAYNPPFALLMSLSLVLAATVSLGGDFAGLLIHMGGLATAVLLLRNVRTRTRLVEVGVAAGFAYLAMTVATGLLTSQTWRFILFESCRHFAEGSLAGFLLSGCLPVVERSFGIITDVSLLELADGSHPLLQELVRRAPGTYNHSLTVATLAEAASEAIGANPLLTRVGSYFHDVGKMLKPHYFVENQTGENRHDSLEPALSTLVIIGHIKDGLALARQYNLPRPIIDFIEQHHGTTLVEYFYREAVRLQESSGNDVTGLESSFRYAGPKPQNRENGVVMLADAAESSSRALKDPAPSTLRKLVHDLVMKRLLDGQFEESDLTLTELHLIEETLSKSLISLYHGRIKYPDGALHLRRAS
jgi:putative nucleotidyltransferase with HDIG domain